MVDKDLLSIQETRALVRAARAGTAVIGEDGTIVGIGSLQLMAASGSSDELPLNMVVPIDILKPVLDDLLTQGRRSGEPRPWLGVYATGLDDQVVIFGLARGGPGDNAGAKTGAVVVAVADTPVDDLAEFYRAVWALGDAGVEVPLTVVRESETIDLTLQLTDRTRLLKGPRLH